MRRTKQGWRLARRTNLKYKNLTSLRLEGFVSPRLIWRIYSMNILERASYLRGLFDGLEIDTSTKEGKLLVAMTEVIDELCEAVSDLQQITDEMSDELDEVAEELLELEGAFDECDCDDDECDCGEDCDCEDFHYEVVCPTCGDSIMVDEDILALGKIQCPGCGEDLEFDMDECICDDDDCDCGCHGHDHE